MMKSAILTLGLLAIAGCTTMQDREASCRCFNADGSTSGSCDFQPLPGQPAVFTFMAETSSLSTRGDMAWLSDAIRKESCSG